MISIRNQEVERIARVMACAKGTSMTQTILDALLYQESIQGERAERRKALIRSIAATCASAQDIDTRSPEEILGYGDDGGFCDGNR